MNVADVRDRIETIREETGSRTTVSAEVTHRAAYETEARSGELRSSAALSINDRTYSLGDGLGASDVYHDRETVTRPAEDRTTVVFGVAVASWSLWTAPLALLGLLGAGHAAAVRRRDPDPRAVERRIERQRFAEWVSHGEVPDDVADRRVAIASLGDLVDVAIDADRRVVHDQAAERYVVIDGAVAYVYVPDDRPPAGDGPETADPLETATARSGGDRTSVPGKNENDVAAHALDETGTEEDDVAARAGEEGMTETDDAAARESADGSATDGVSEPEAEEDESDSAAVGTADEFVWSDPASESDSEA